jgi:hypothetical protein
MQPLQWQLGIWWVLPTVYWVPIHRARISVPQQWTTESYIPELAMAALWLQYSKVSFSSLLHSHTHSLCLCVCVSFLCMHVCIICIFLSQHRTWIYLLSFDSHIQVWCNEYAHEVKGPTSGFCRRLHGSNTVGVTCLPANEWSPWQVVSERDSWKNHYKDNTTPCCLVPRVQCDHWVLPISMARAYWAASKACT